MPISILDNYEFTRDVGLTVDGSIIRLQHLQQIVTGRWLIDSFNLSTSYLPKFILYLAWNKQNKYE